MKTRLPPYVLNSALIVSASFVLTACSGQSIPGSQLFGQNAYIAPVLKPLAALERNANAQTLWQVKTGGTISNAKIRPFVNSAAIYTANGVTVSAHDKTSGKLLWSNPIGEYITGGVNGNEATVFVGSREGTALAIDAKTGRTQWIAALGTEVLAVSPAAQGRAVFRTIDGKLHGLDSASGEVMWQRQQRTPQLSIYGASVPIIVDKGVIAGFDNGRLAAYSLQSGGPIWEVTLSAPKGSSELDQLVDIDGRLKPLGNALFASNNNGRIAGINMGNGSVGWAKVFSSISGADANKNGVFSADEKGHIWKINPLTGKSVWSQDDLENRRPTTPTLTASGNHVVVGDRQGNIHWIDTNSQISGQGGNGGQITARISGDPAGYTVPMLKSGNTIYALGRGGVLTAIRSQ
ncbi:MAG: PQQ-binding-like beta-propeller repeat protein [Leucothrix sp.]